MTLPCVVCKRELESVFPENAVDNQPNEGMVFISYGNYGSTVFDPIVEAMFLEINICDSCVIAAGERKQVLLARPPLPSNPIYSEWNYNKEMNT